MTDLAAAERDKYERMWREPSYRINSPGLRELRRFLDGVPWAPGQTVLDAGCGLGRAGLEMSRLGLEVTLLDLVATSRAPEAHRLPFLEATLWNLPRALGAFDWIFCVDVLEHLPEEQIEAALHHLAARTRRGGFLQIACFPDACGNIIGERLHLTIQPPTWWSRRVARHWTQMRDLSDGQYARFVIGAPHAE
jgi:2-polyprenyl-3-methyl-5-hydroxy-6-metoxy-1,4-benzoquinol methylase